MSVTKWLGHRSLSSTMARIAVGHKTYCNQLHVKFRGENMARPPGVSDFMFQLEAASYRDPLAPNERETLMRVAASPRVSVAELAEQAQLAPENVSRIVKKLIGLKWLLERVDETDRRVKRLGLTPA